MRLDLSLPDNYYFAKLQAIYKKYDRFLSCKETALPTIKRNSSSKDELKPLALKKNSSK